MNKMVFFCFLENSYDQHAVVHLVVLQQYQTEVELGEGQLQVLDVPVFASFLLGQSKNGPPPPQAAPVCPGLPLGIQGGLELILQCSKSPLRLSQLFWWEEDKSNEDDARAFAVSPGSQNVTEFYCFHIKTLWRKQACAAVFTRIESVDLGQFFFTCLEELLLKFGIVPLNCIFICDWKIEIHNYYTKLDTRLNENTNSHQSDRRYCL